MATVPRPMNPFVQGDPNLARLLMSPQIGTPQPMQPAPQGGLMEAMMTAARAAPTLQPSDLPTPEAAPAMPAGPSQGIGAGIKDFLGSDAALAFAAGALGGGSTSQALGRGMSYALSARQPKATSGDLALYAQAKKEGYAGTLIEFLKEKDARQAGMNLGLTPVYYRDAEGNIRAGQMSQSGQFKPIEIPGGGEVLDPYAVNYQKAAGGAAGKGMGEAEATLASMQAKLPGLEFVVQKLDKLAKQATYTVGGRIIDEAMRQSGMEPREAAIARAEYIAMVDNQILPLLRDTFGAQFTEREGATLRATLGDPNRSPKEKQALLRAFIEQKRRDIEALVRQTGKEPGASATGGGNSSSPDPLGIR